MHILAIFVIKRATFVCILFIPSNNENKQILSIIKNSTKTAYYRAHCSELQFEKIFCQNFALPLYPLLRVKFWAQKICSNCGFDTRHWSDSGATRALTVRLCPKPSSGTRALYFEETDLGFGDGVLYFVREEPRALHVRRTEPEPYILKGWSLALKHYDWA